MECNEGDLDKEVEATDREEDDNRGRSDEQGSEFSDVLDVDEEIVDLEDVVVASDGGLVEDTDADLEVVGGGCNEIGSVEGGRLSRSSWRKYRRTSHSRSSGSLTLSCSSAC